MHARAICGGMISCTSGIAGCFLFFGLFDFACKPGSSLSCQVLQRFVLFIALLCSWVFNCYILFNVRIVACLCIASELFMDMQHSTVVW